MPPDSLRDPTRLRALAKPPLLDGRTDESFDRVTALVAALLSAPVALVSIIANGQQVIRSCVGLAASEPSLSQAFCRHVVASDKPLVVPDARHHSPVAVDLAEPDVVAYAGWPLRLDGHVLGSLCAIDSRPRQWSAEDLAVLEQLAGLAESVIALRHDTLAERVDHGTESAHHHEVEVLSRRLQLALLPRDVDDARVQTAYDPGSARLLVGGDFADVRVTADGTLDFVIGDVSGHGPEAAALAAALRASWGTLRRQAVALDDVLAALEHVVLAERADEELYATVLVGTLEAHGRLCLATAGHPLPIVLDDQPARVIHGPPGLLLGIGGGARWQAMEARVADAHILIYTDGLIEGRRAPDDLRRFGIDGLLAAIDDRRPHRNADLITHLIATATQANGGPLADDVTMLLLRGSAARST